MTKAAELAKMGEVLTNSQIGGRRNLFYNPKFDVAQRGTSFSKTTSAIYTLDRWQATSGSSFNLDTTITQSTTVPSGQGFKHSLKVEADSVVTPSGSDNGGILQKLEQQDVEHLMYGTSDAKNLTLSFWVRSNKTGIYCVQFQTNQGSSTASEKYLHVKEYTISSANTWEKKTLIFPGHTVQAFNAAASNGEALRVNWWLATGSDDHVSADTWIQSGSFASTSNQVNFMDSADNEWYLCGCQLELSLKVTPFEHRSFGEELALCQRYYFNPWLNAERRTYQVNGFRHGSGWIFSMNFPMTMRAAPTIDFGSTPDDDIGINSTGGGVSVRPTSEFSAANIGIHGCRLTSSWSGTYSTGDPGAITNDDASGCTLNIDAEL
tara:strand:+ start:684 stop:1817 length:1134 start_codon:yes stop_codon:yes gene_type:complete